MSELKIASDRINALYDGCVLALANRGSSLGRMLQGGIESSDSRRFSVGIGHAAPVQLGRVVASQLARPASMDLGQERSTSARIGADVHGTAVVP